jgi:atypical dual specificity phosphatase
MYEQIKYRNMTPEAALDHARSVRPRVLLAPSQWQVWSVTFSFLLPRL